MFVEKNLDVCQVEQREGYTGAAIKMRLKIYKKLWPRCTVCEIVASCALSVQGIVGLWVYWFMGKNQDR